MSVCVRVRARNIPLYIYVIAVYLLVSYMCAQLESEFGHVWLLTSLVYLLNLLYVNYCGVVGGRMASNLSFINFSQCSFFYGALCPRSCRAGIMRHRNVRYIYIYIAY